MRYPAPLPDQVWRRDTLSGGHFVAPNRHPFLTTGSAGHLSLSRTPLHVRSAPWAPVEQGKPGTARRASGDSTASR